MKFGKMFRFEFRYQLRHVSTWLLFAGFFSFGFVILRMVTLTDGTHLNAPGTIAFFTVFGSTIWVVTGGVVAGDAATRDRQTRMHPLACTTPVRKGSYLGARFLAALALNGLMMLALYAGFLLSQYGPGAKPELLGPFRPASYLAGYAFLALPAVLVTTALQFAGAALTGRAVASYVASVLLILFSQFGGTTVRFLLEWKVLGSLMDLLGTGIVAEMEGWTPLDKNTRLVLPQGTWLWNRIAWLAVAAGALAFTYFRFRLAHAAPGPVLFGRRRDTTRAAAPDAFGARGGDAIPASVPVIPRDFARATHARQALAIAGSSFRVVATSRGGLTLVAALAVGTGLFAPEYLEWLGVPLLARTEEVLRTVAPPLGSYQTPWIIIPLLTLFYAGELVWREREAGLGELADAAPVPGWAMLLGKYAGLALLITAWVACLLGAGILAQLVVGYHHFETGVYLKALFGIQLTNYLLFAALVLAIHVLVNHKYTGHVAACGAYGYLLFAPAIGVEHKLLVYASDPGWSYSDMRGFGPFITPWLWFKGYWASWALLLAVLATVFRVRGKEGGFKARLRLARHRFPRHRPALLIALGLVAGTGGFIFYNTNVRNPYANAAGRLAMRAEYERRYGRYAYRPQPDLVRAALHVELYPDAGSADIRSKYFLVNRSPVAIDTLYVSTVPRAGNIAAAFNRRAVPVVLDDALGFRVYALPDPLRPGDSLQMRFEVRIRPRGFGSDGVEAAVVANGSHVTSDAWMPVIGYREDRRLRNAVDRATHGLPPRPEKPPLHDVAARRDARHARQLDFEAVVGTAGDQVAVAPGELRRTWTKGDRRYFHYVTNAPIHHEYAFFSARYAVREAQWQPRAAAPREAGTHGAGGPQNPAKPVTIQVYHHPSHDANVGRMVKSAQAALAYYAREFGPYPYSHFRVLERPGPGRGMHAAPMTIDYQEGYSLMNPAPGGLDLPYHIMAHEVAHQWWGLQLSPAAVEGAGLLVESLATYSAMQVVEETLGYAHLLRYLSQMRREYEVPRSRAAPPLLRAGDAFMLYRKGPFALFALRHYIGKDRVNDAIRRMLPGGAPGPPLPTTLDFYRELREVTPDSLHSLVHDLFAANTFWELKTEQVTATRTGAGTWQVTLTVAARKVTVDRTGIETNRPVNDWIEIGVYAPRAGGKAPAKAIYLRKHRIRSGRQTILLQVPEKPGRAGIDPNHLLNDWETDDNVRAVQ